MRLTKFTFPGSLGWIIILALASPLAITADLHAQPYVDNSPGYTITAYYWPDYHVDPRNEQWFGPGWTEWELIKAAKPRFEGHNQPRVPLWGHEDESDPTVMAKKIDAAAQYGVDVLIFDWYYFEDGSFLRSALDRGFVGAPNNTKVKFALMWANHDMPDVFPAKLRLCAPNWDVLLPGKVSRQTFDTMVDEMISHYFKHSSYWLIDGCPYFSIYDLDTLVEGLGGLEETRHALQDFRAKTKAAGFADLHLNVILRGDRVIAKHKSFTVAGGETVEQSFDQNELLQKLGFNSIGSYTWLHNVAMPDFPQTQYALVREKALEHVRRTVTNFRLPFHPNVTCGWDSTPRTCPTDVYLNKGYPFGPTISGNTPQAFKESLTRMKEFLDSTDDSQKIFSINSWNEWSEGSYLEPDTTNGFGFLKAIGEVFGNQR